MSPDTLHLLTVEEVAGILQIPEKRVRNSPIAQVRLGPKTIRFDARDVQRYIEKMKLRAV